MSSIPTLKLPLIDLSKLDGSKPGTGRWDSLLCQVRRALEEFGCFEALYDKMTLELHNDMFQELEELLELPTDVKRRFVVPEKRFNGYHTNPPQAPPYEAFGMDYGPNSGSINRLADLMWPEGNTRFCETMNTYVTRVLELDSLVRKLVLGSLGVDKYVDSLARSVKYNFRLMGYAPPGNDESKKPDTTCHRDANFVTILHQNHVNGLEMQTKDGRWIEVAPSSACSFIVLTGESFYGWSNGRLHSPRHRVRVSGHERRYSIGLFSSDQGTVQCPDELVDDQHPLLFKPFDVAGLSRIYNTKEGKSGASAMDTFYRI
ncbi:probable 2-oxoglutarate-dependent dioxygenase AOP1 [Syzygium oleosum]|uniref:probable 2-oxoglutarate-dependent dioxygenase AOP1 n=1 Tax=Syzygium oleosum TaxID=219896 RepID=UPI0024B9C101|nr:probable 2-oxoglutarate-dependent dioxygenase AOP1 [Syzygium oleosum]